MSTFVNSIYGLKIEHTTYAFLRFFVKMINFRIYQDDDLKESMTTTNMTVFLKRYKEIVNHWNDIFEGIHNVTKKEFDMESKIAFLQAEFNQAKKLGGDPKILLEKLTAKIKQVNQEYHSLLNERKLKNCNEKYSISLTFHDDVGSGNFIYEYDINLNKFEKDIFDFFQSNIHIPKIEFGDYKLYENLSEEGQKYYLITRKDLTIDPTVMGDYKKLGDLIKEWIHQDRLFCNDSLEKISIHFD